MSLFGSALQRELENAPGKTEKARKAKQQQIIQRWIPEAVSRKTAKHFRDAAKT